MNFFRPRLGLAAQMIVLLLVALIVSQILVAFLFAHSRHRDLLIVRKDFFVDRMASLVELLEATDPDVHPQILKAVRNRLMRIDLHATAPIADDQYYEDRPRDRETLAAMLRERDIAVGDIVFRVAKDGLHLEHWGPPPKWKHREDGARARRAPSTIVGVELSSGQWLHFKARPPGPRRGLGFPLMLNMVVMAAGVVLIAILIARWMSHPLTKLAQSADRLGRGELVPEIDEQGPKDIQDTIKAFNTMNRRLQKFMDSQRRMVAAIGHDLRTPITALRIRAEFVEDTETREKMMATLGDMHAMTEAVLAFARGEGADERTRTVDLAALVRTIADDMTDLGADVSVTGTSRLAYPCRPTALKRALNNIIENGLKYGEAVEITITEGREGAVEIVVADQGPGIPEADFQRVFSPFVRLEESRNRETGGTGLGLPIALSVVESHGGDIRLTNRPEGGLAVTISLPAVSV